LNPEDGWIEHRQFPLRGSINAIEHQEMSVRMEIQRTSKSLNGGHRAALGLRYSTLARTLFQEFEYRSNHDPEHFPKQRRIESHPIPQRIRQ